MAALVAAIHAFDLSKLKAWMPGTSPGMTNFESSAYAVAPARRGAGFSMIGRLISAERNVPPTKS